MKAPPGPIDQLPGIVAFVEEFLLAVTLVTDVDEIGVGKGEESAAPGR